MGPVTKLVGGGIGLVKEAQAHHARSKSPQPPVDPDHPTASDDEDSNSVNDDYLDTDEAHWNLDDAQVRQQPSNEKPDNNDTDTILENFFRNHPPPSYSKATGDLPLPVIIPQKRPGSKLHGFVHGYAPVLADCDIDQKTWFDFLDGFGRAIKYSPGFHIANAAVALAALGVTIVAGPMLITHAVALAIHVSIESTRRGYIRFQSNKYLDTMNEKLFKPRGLYSMVFAYKPNSSKAVETVDLSEQQQQPFNHEQSINDAVAKRSDGAGPKLGGASGVAYHDFELPESAPLIFPELDDLPTDEKAGKMKQTGQFLTDYYNRRARAEFETAHPDSKLNVLPSPEFASRFSDPTHPASQGNIVNLVTGGKIDRGTTKERLAKRKEMLQSKTGRTGKKKRGGGILGGAKRKMHEDVVYLMVVNMPSSEELEEATREIAKNDQEEVMHA